jgi:hypothetical protein
MEEAKAAYRWYAERNPLAALAFAAELEHATQEIAEHPSRWPPYLGRTRRFLLHRSPTAPCSPTSPSRPAASSAGPRPAPSAGVPTRGSLTSRALSLATVRTGGEDPYRRRHAPDEESMGE